MEQQEVTQFEEKQVASLVDRNRELRKALVQIIYHNVFFDAILSSMALTLLDEAFARYDTLRNYPYAKVNFEADVDPDKFTVVTTMINSGLTLNNIMTSPHVVVDIIATTLAGMLYSVTDGSRWVAGTVRIHAALQVEANDSRIAFVLTAVKAAE